MEVHVLGELMQFSQQERQSTKQEDEKQEPTVISRRQAELEAANDRLQQTAQNFSIEWKSFLGYAMKIKQQRTSGATGNSPSGERDLEDLLLKSQGGLVLLREVHSRREQQWKAVLERYGYEHTSPTASSEREDASPDSDLLQKQVARQPQWLQTLSSKLLVFNQQVAATSHCAVKRSQLTVDHNHTQTSRMLPTQSLVLAKQSAHALETHHRLVHALDSASEKPSPPDFVTVDDVNKLLQFHYMKHQQAVVLERFCTRLKWLPVSHRFHLRQRMLALIHQQKVKNTPRPNGSTAYRNSKDHIHCPLFMMSTSHFIAEMKSLAQKFSLSFSEEVDIRDNKASVEEFQILRQGADKFLASAVSAFPPDNTINLDANLEVSLESLVHAYTRNSRWELIQRGYLRNCEPGQGGIADTLIVLRNDHKIDSLLANEWELLSLDDVGYLCVRLEALSGAHMNRAKVDVTKSESAAAGNVASFENRRQSGQATGGTADDDESGNGDETPSSKPKTGLPRPWNPDAVYSLYVMRVSSCRTKRLSLLRLLNYLHFVQLCQTSSLQSTAYVEGAFKVTSGLKPPLHGSVEGATTSPWVVTKCDKTGDHIVMRATIAGKEDIDDEEKDDNNYGLQEFIFAAARRDLEVLELQMLRIASIFIFKQEYDSLPTSPRKHNNVKYDNDQDSDSFVSTIDRLQVLRDIYDCEVAFQQAKVQLVERLLDFGLEFAPRAQDVSELGLAPQDDQTEPFTAILFPLLQRRPLIEFSHAYFFESYVAETLLLELQASLVQQMGQHFQRLKCQQLLDLQNTVMQQLRNQFQAVTMECQKIEKQWTKAQVEERIRREAFAVDHAFHLYFEVEALRKQLGVLEARRELEQQILRCDLNAEYDEKLRVMHAELLNKQQKFAEYRTTMQRELQSVIQGAHSQFVDQLLDYSGAIPSATKTSVATLLRGQQDVVRIKSENAAMKQALLKVHALGDMQQQTQNAARDRELLLTQRFATAEALQRNEVETLQAYVKQLEGNLSKLSQEKTFFQVKWTTAQKQMGATAQRRREAKAQ
ncbi:Replication factor C subunit 3 [Phytophthora cinnamomi]|uniref:Replication factor C subunit 3 n=1 Tax=Phytophthora cinnamomi TaxID=4785 RepID=UPI0035594682|nr:Replication factor C subunit 3 [Phytophthora cinnamomi]